MKMKDGHATRKHYENLRLEGKRERSLLSRLWSRRSFDHRDDPKQTVMDLIRIRESVRNVLRVHGVPRDTEVIVAENTGCGTEASGFRDPVKCERPFILLDVEPYRKAEPDDVLDIYCALGLHGSGHTLHGHGLIRDMATGGLDNQDRTWRNILEDNRIEALTMEQSPGFAPYIQAGRNFFGRETAEDGIKRWPDLPDEDRATLVGYLYARYPYLLTQEMREFTTLGGVHVYGEFEKILKKPEESYEDVKRDAGRIKALMACIRKSSKDAAQEMLDGDSEPGDSGEPGEAENGDPNPGLNQGDSGGSEGQDTESEDSPEGDEGRGSDTASGETEGQDTPSEGQSDGDDTESSEGQEGQGDVTDGDDMDGEDTDGQADGEDSSAGVGESRIRRAARELSLDSREEMQYADARAVLERQLKAAEKELAYLPDASGTLSDNFNFEEERRGGHERVEEIKKKIEALDRVWEDSGRWTYVNILKVIDAQHKVNDTLTEDEVQTKNHVERMRLEFGEGFMDNYGGEHRSVILHPEPTETNKARYEAWLTEIKGHIQAVRRLFRVRRGNRTVKSPEKRTGLLHRKRLSHATVSNRIFYKRRQEVEDGLAVCLVLDESGSMGDLPDKPGGSGYTYSAKAENAFKCGQLFAEACMGIPGIELEVYSFTTFNCDRDSQVKCLYSPIDNPNKYSMGDYGTSLGSNFDHLAIREVAKKFERNTVNDNRVLIVMSDGQPAGQDYGGEPAMAMVREEVEKLEKKGWFVMQVAIDSVTSEKMFRHFCTFTDLPTLFTQMKKLLVRIFKKSTRRRTL